MRAANIQKPNDHVAATGGLALRFQNDSFARLTTTAGRLRGLRRNADGAVDRAGHHRVPEMEIEQIRHHDGAVCKRRPGLLLKTHTCILPQRAVAPKILPKRPK